MKGLNIFSFIDDLDTFENDERESNYSDIYCGELKLKKENENPCNGLLLNLSLKCHDKKIFNRFFDDRDGFSIYISYTPYLDRNISSKYLMLQLVYKFCLLPGQQQT